MDFQSELPQSLLETQLAINQERGCGNVSIFFSTHNYEKSPNLVELFVENCGLRANVSWKSVGLEEAFKLVSSAIGTEMAFEDQTIPDERVRILRESYLNSFGVDMTNLDFYTNRRWNFKTNRLASSWTSVSKATFNLAIVVVSQGAIGILLAEDED